MKDIKYIALDLDGSLLNDDLEILPKTKTALIDVQKKGIKLIIATGRPLKAILKYSEELDMDKNDGLIIANNGGLIYSYKEDKVIYEDRISLEDAKDTFSRLEEFDVYPFYRDEEYMFVEDVFAPIIDTKTSLGTINSHEFESRLGDFLLKEVPRLKDYVDKPVLKIMAASNPDYLDKNLDKINKKLNDNIYCARTATYIVEFIKKGISKGQTLKKLNISEDKLIAFGDSMNDFEMIEYAKYGIAMENAMDKLKEISYDITKSNNDEGIYYMLEKMKIVD